MAEAIVSTVLQQLTSITIQEIRQGVRLVGDVKKEVEKLKRNLQAIQVLLVDAEQRQLKETPVRVWLDHLKEVSYDMEDVLDEWNTAIMKQEIQGDHENTLVPKKKVCLFFRSHCFGVKQVVLRHDIALKIKEINEKLDAIAREKDMYNLNVITSIQKRERVQSTCLIDVSEIYGRDDEKSLLLSKLFCDGSEEHKGLHIISIVGMGGIGKTTLAQLAYNDNIVKNNFDITIWVCVSNPFDEYRIAKAIIESLEGSTTSLVEFNSLIQKIDESIKGKKFLFVLDDVWIEDYNKWEPFYHCLKNGLHGSKILITTRKEKVARMMKSMDIINVKELSKEGCWSLFRQLAFFDRSQEECEKLEEIGRKIVGKCKGLPLAAKTMGSLLCFKKTREEWQNILDNEMWKLEEFEKGILPPLLLSYRDLSSMEKQCFSYCSIFPKDYVIWKEDLIKLWMAQGYLELEENKEKEIIGEEYFNNLAARSFFQEFVKDDDKNIKGCKMHDIIHDFAQFLSKNEFRTIEVNGVEKPLTNFSNEKIHHSMLKLKEGDSFPVSILNARRLRSLLIDCDVSSFSLPNDVLLDLFGKLTCLRALKLGEDRGFIKEIPKEIGKLIHLRYLDLSLQCIEKLPEALCELHNLQTLNLCLCTKLKELPQGIGKLKNLRHLINYGTRSLSSMPIGIERLICLRTLNEFIVSGDDGLNNKTKSVECLKHFNNLRGHFIIKGLGNVSNVSEINRINVLKNKSNLFFLELIFTKDGGRERVNEDDELLLEALQPPPNLNHLSIRSYRGKSFPSNWILSLTKLRKLTLFAWKNCKHVSSLGILSSLEELSIYEMHNVKRTDNEFWGIESDVTSMSMILFPKLKNLGFWYIKEWEEWDYEITKYDREENITIMPCLVSLTFDNCPKLKLLPDCHLQCTTLQRLYISNCPILKQRYEKEIGEDWPKISHIPYAIIR